MPDEIDTSNMSAEEIAELQKQNCIFCKIAEKQIPAKIIHEDKEIICVLDINPASEGHILVYPKKHYMILPHIPDEVQAQLFKHVQLMSHTLLKTLQCKGTSIFIANGAAAGQRAPHVLVHVFPRREGDGLVTLPAYEMDEAQITKLKSNLKPYLNQFFGVQKHDKDAEFRDVEGEKAQEHTPKKSVAPPKTPKAEVVDETEETRQEVQEKSKPVKGITKKSAPKSKPVIEEKPKTVPRANLDDIAKLFGA